MMLLYYCKIFIVCLNILLYKLFYFDIYSITYYLSLNMYFIKLAIKQLKNKSLMYYLG